MGFDRSDERGGLEDILTDAGCSKTWDVQVYGGRGLPPPPPDDAVIHETVIPEGILGKPIKLTLTLTPNLTLTLTLTLILMERELKAWLVRWRILIVNLENLENLEILKSMITL